MTLAALTRGGVRTETIRMTAPSRLRFQKLVAMVATRDAVRAKAFHGGTLGLPLVREDQFALVFEAQGTALRVSIVPDLAPAKYTVLGWEVADIAATAKELEDAGVKLEQYGFKGQDQTGIWTSPSGARVAWFKDPDGNVLSVTQF